MDIAKLIEIASENEFKIVEFKELTGYCIDEFRQLYLSGQLKVVKVGEQNER